ncbi:MAG: cbb3-type cytochrome c oxidase subunit I [Rhodocyclaceae bacterium]|nr:cbb3-type cytochrome c oxidase subunit I [Rhodocyclaceae bacterium]
MTHFGRDDDAGRRRHAQNWLALAAGAVAAAGLFAILIALARVPAIGKLFPGPEFYRVALTLHVTLSQGVWFMAFAACLWALDAPRRPTSVDHLSLAAAALGTIGIALSVGVGEPAPLMSNYLPVLDSRLFTGAFLLFGLALALRAARSALPLPWRRPAGLGDVRALGLRLAAIGFCASLLLALLAHRVIAEGVDGLAYYESLFWGAGHLWQFVLVLLMMVCWLVLAPPNPARLAPAVPAGLLLLAAAPIVAGIGLATFRSPLDADYIIGFTRLMQWASWPAPVILFALLLRTSPRAMPGFGLSAVLFIQGLLIGAAIDGQTTLVTAHYHGTIGAVTLAFMATALQLLPRLGATAVSAGAARSQLACYGWGIMLMMLGLAGAGLMGAPRKTPGDLGLSWSIETISRIMLGIGGLLATIGILMFAYLVLMRLWPVALGRGIENEAAR